MLKTKNMINKFLNAKHWQLFLLLFGIPFLLQMFMMQHLFSSFENIESQGDLTPLNLDNFFIATIGVTVLYMAIFYGWLWSIGTGLQSKIPENLNMKVGRFKIALIYPVIYMSLFVFFISSVFSSPQNLNTSLFSLIIPLHLLAMFCIFYAMYFIAKTIKTAELKTQLRFSDFAGEFFLLWFYPIGVWILQPRINQIHQEEMDHDIDQHLVE